MRATSFSVRPATSLTRPTFDVLCDQPVFRSTVNKRTDNEKTIYEIYSPRQKFWLLTAASCIGFLLPFRIL